MPTPAPTQLSIQCPNLTDLLLAGQEEFSDEDSDEDGGSLEGEGEGGVEGDYSEDDEGED